MQGNAHENRGFSEGRYIGDGNPGPYGGGTYTNAGGGGEHETVMRNYEEIFGPAARDIKYDAQRSKRHQRWHLPDTLAGYNPFLTDRIDGLITDATNSPFTSVILPYQYVAKPDGKLKWNAWSFDEGMASRVPYESAARVLTQTKRSFAAYTVRQGLAIVMEHNFMASPEGMENFRNQVRQMVGSIQYTNDLDVHMALIQAPSYARTIAEKYHTPNRTPQQLVRQYVDLFGIVQKNPNAVDLLIEEAKAQMRDWGSQEPNFLLCNSKLTLQLTMSPEKTNYVTQGIDGVKRLRAGPDIPSYRGVNIIKSRSFSMEKNMPPRDVLRRRVRVAEYYWIPYDGDNEGRTFDFYDQGRDSWVTFTYPELRRMAVVPPGVGNRAEALLPDPDFEPLPFEDRSFLGMRQGGGRGPAGGGRGPPGGAARVASAFTQLPLGEWNSRPYHMKVALLSSVGGLLIRDDKQLHCDSKFDETERGFVQVAQEAVNFTGTTDLTAYVNSSAWIGGGLFCDTTYHFKEGNSYATPLCNWAALDAVRMTGNGAETIDRIFQFGRGMDWATLQDTVPDPVLLNFAPYQPNNFKFSLSGAHAPGNLIDVNSPEQAAAARFASLSFTTQCVGKLLATVDVIPAVQQAFHDFIVPLRSKTGAADEEHRVATAAALANITPGRNPFRTVLMCMLMGHIHPNDAVRGAARTAIGVRSLQAAYRALRGVAMTDVPDATRFGDEFPGVGAVPTAPWWNTQDQLTGVTTPLPSAQGVGDERLATIFAIIGCKRMFCGAARFSEAGNPAVTTQYGLALLNRSYATLGVVNGDGHIIQRSTDAGDVGIGAGNQVHLLLVRPNIEHEMLGMILGRGGTAELGATLWGQTELSCYDDSQHGIWGMSYKYHERAQVFNERNMVRTWDVAFDGYNGGLGSDVLEWTNADIATFGNDTEDFTRPYNGKSFVVMAIPAIDDDRLGQQLPNPIVWYDNGLQVDGQGHTMTDPENIHRVVTKGMRIVNQMDAVQQEEYRHYMDLLPDFAGMQSLRKIAGNASAANESSPAGSLAFQGTMRVRGPRGVEKEVNGSGHLGNSYVGVAAVRDGRGILVNSQPMLQRLV